MANNDVASIPVLSNVNPLTMKGLYLLTAEQPPDDDKDFPKLQDRWQQIVVYATEGDFIEFLTNDDETITNNVKLDKNGNKIFEIERYNEVDGGRIVFSNKEERFKVYKDIKFLFDGEIFSELFKSAAEIDEIYMQTQTAQHCRWNQHQPLNEMYTECMEAIIEFNTVLDKKYPGYDPNFKMPSPEEIERLKVKLGIK